MTTFTVLTTKVRAICAQSLKMSYFNIKKIHGQKIYDNISCCGGISVLFQNRTLCPSLFAFASCPWAPAECAKERDHGFNLWVCADKRPPIGEQAET
jgi:hypothetical protein